jgi:GxxExxY protein
MPITCPICLRPLDQEEFARLDYDVMRCAYTSHNQLGRLCDEVIYQNDLAVRLQIAGLGPVLREVSVTVTYRDFSKTYRLDLVVCDAAVYELKAEVRLASEHEAQLLDYLLLCGSHHGKLVNFRPPRVESRFVNTTLTPEAQREFKVETKRWRAVDPASQLFQTMLLELLADWGGFLQLSLYTEALVHVLGGEQKVVQKLGLWREGLSLGNQRFHLLSPQSAFRLTALPDGTEEYEPQLRALLEHSSLKTLQWVNLARHRVQFITLDKDKE